MRTYDELVEFYVGLSKDPRPSWADVVVHAKAILKLLPMIKGNSVFDPLVMGPAHATLWIGHDEAEKVVHIWGVTEDQYELSVYDARADRNIDETTVGSEGVIAALQKYIARVD